MICRPVWLASFAAALVRASFAAVLVLASHTAARGDDSPAGKPARSLIIHADDAGMSHSANMATIEGLEHGVVTSTSILVPCAWFPEFAAYARKHPERDYGIHLTLTCEWKNYRWGPVAPRDKVPSLLDDQGYLPRDNPPVVATAKLSEAETELRAQIDRAKAFGIRLSHLDTHMGTLLDRPDFLELYVNLGIAYNLPVMFTRQASLPAFQAKYPALRGNDRQLLDMLDTHHLPVLSSVVMLYNKGEHSVRTHNYFKAFEALQPGVNELIVHCGIDNPELEAITDSAPLRDSDRRFVTDPDTKAQLARMGITLTNWGEFRQSVDRK
jgi:chitin disaccharide deacetylase